MGNGDIRMFLLIVAVFLLIYYAFIGVMELKKLIVNLFNKNKEKKDMQD